MCVLEVVCAAFQGVNVCVGNFRDSGVIYGVQYVCVCVCVCLCVVCEVIHMCVCVCVSVCCV